MWTKYYFFVCVIIVIVHFVLRFGEEGMDDDE